MGGGTQIQWLDYQYRTIRAMCCIDLRIKVPDDYRSPYYGDVAAHRIAELEREAAVGNGAPLLIEHALRELAGWNTNGTARPIAAMHYLGPILGRPYAVLCPVNSDTQIDQETLADNRYLTRAYSLSAFAHLLMFRASDREEVVASLSGPSPIPLCLHDSPVGALIHAAVEAANASKFGFVSAAVVDVGFTFKRLMKWAQDIDAYEYRWISRSIWPALEDNLSLFIERHRSVNEAWTLLFDPDGDLLSRTGFCARPGCDNTRAIDNAPVRPCNGTCLPSFKTSYCSGVCQHLHSAHLHVCDGCVFPIIHWYGGQPVLPFIRSQLAAIGRNRKGLLKW